MTPAHEKRARERARDGERLARMARSRDISEHRTGSMVRTIRTEMNDAAIDDTSKSAARDTSTL
jgi:hypothetical protein